MTSAAPRRGGGEKSAPPPLLSVLREWGRIGCIGFGGHPPTSNCSGRCVSNDGSSTPSLSARSPPDRSSRQLPSSATRRQDWAAHCSRQQSRWHPPFPSSCSEPVASIESEATTVPAPFSMEPRPAAVRAILSSAIPLARALTQPWQYAVLAAAALCLLPLRRGAVPTLLLAGLADTLIALAGDPHRNKWHDRSQISRHRGQFRLAQPLPGSPLVAGRSHCVVARVCRRRDPPRVKSKTMPMPSRRSLHACR
jgi:hypothetical protein